VATMNRSQGEQRAASGRVNEHAREVVTIDHVRFGDLFGLRNLQSTCFQGGQAYGIATLLVFYLWPRADILVARFGDEVIGCVVGDVQRDQARILNLCVAPEFRRQGIGTALLQAMERRLDRDNITLMVEDKNMGAQVLYRKFEYLPVGDLRDYYGRNRHGVLMQKRRVTVPVGYRPELTVSDGRHD
jgi:[ribosomal protein S18]-alanine N-acetyltransferase